MRAKWICAATLVCVVGGAFAGPQADVDTVISGRPHDAFFSVAIDGATGIAVGAGGAIYDSTDSGKTWKAEASTTELSLLGVDSRGSMQVAVGQTGIILRRDMPGAWQKVDGGSSERLFAVSVNSKGLAVAVGSFGTVLKSEDGARTWTRAAPDWEHYTADGSQPHLYDVKVDEMGAITIAGEFGLILRSEAGRPGWQVLHKGEASLFALDLRADGVGYAVGQSGLVIRTLDGGRSWVEMETGVEANLLAVRSAPGGTVVVTAMHDLIASRDGGKTWQHKTGADVSASWYAGIASASRDEPPLAVGAAGKIIRIGKN